jgi:hypothetical protein
VTRNRFILISLSVILVILTISGLVLWRVSKKNQANVDQRFPVQGLKYCSSSPVTPCVVSFSQDADGNMLVSFLTERFLSGLLFEDQGRRAGTHLCM